MDTINWPLLFLLSVLSQVELTQASTNYRIYYRNQKDMSGVMLTDEQRLLRDLTWNYDPAVRPVFDAKTPVVIKLGITLTQVIDVDEKNQVLTTNVWLDQEWHDEKLVWNMSDYNNITILRVPCDFIWLPDIVLYNSVDNHNKGYMKSLAMVHDDGNVFWPPIVRMRSSCKMDITYFPFDDQLCALKLGSWAYDGFQVDVTNRSDNVDLSNYVDNGEWELLGTKVIRRVKFYTCCPEPFIDVTFYIMIRRRVLYYFLNVIIPCMMLSSLSLTGFLLPPESGEKVTLGLTVLLAFSVFMLLVAENMPPTSEYIPLIGIYLTVIMAMSALSVALSVFVLNCHHRGTSMRRPPHCVRLFSRFVARVLRMRLLHIKEVNIDDTDDSYSSPVKSSGRYSRSPKKKVNSTMSNVGRGRKPLCCSSSPSDTSKPNIYSSGGGGDASSSKSLLNRHNNGVQQQQHRFSDEGNTNTNVFLQKSDLRGGVENEGTEDESSSPRFNSGSARSCQLLVDDATSTAPLHRAPVACSVPSTPTRSCCPPPPPPPISPRLLTPNPDCTWCAEFRESGEFTGSAQQASATSSSGGGKGTRESRKTHMEAQILYYLRAVLETFDKGQGERTAVLEWQEVARVLDKFFFWLFVLITSLTTVFLLLLSPITKEVEFPTE